MTASVAPEPTTGLLWLQSAESKGGSIDAPDALLPWPHPSRPKPDSTENVLDDSTGQLQEQPQKVDQVIRLRRSAMEPRRFEVLQQFEGTVDGVANESVSARVHDLTNPDNPQEVLELPIREFSMSDRPLLKPGCIFYWIMGYETSRGGSIRRVSEIRLRRTPFWSQSKLDAIKAKARATLKQLTSNDPIDSTTTG